MAAATVESGARSVVGVSVHVAPAAWHPALLRALLDALARSVADGPVVVGGDFNAARHRGEVYPGRAQSWFFERMAERGLFECHWALHGREVQTYFGRTVEPYQTDHFFVDEPSKARVVACTVLDYERVRRLSDHAPAELRVS